MHTQDTPLSIMIGIVRRFDRVWFVTRLRELITAPASGWRTVRELPDGIADLYGKWIIPGAILTVGFRLIRQLFVGPAGVEFLRVKVSVLGMLTHHLVDFALALLFPFVAAALVERVGRFMGLTFSHHGALRWIGFALAPMILVSPLALLPVVGDLVIGLASLYALYLMYLGFKELARCEESQRLGLFAAALLVIALSYFVLSNIAGRLQPQQYTIVFGAG